MRAARENRAAKMSVVYILCFFTTASLQKKLGKTKEVRGRGEAKVVEANENN